MVLTEEGYRSCVCMSADCHRTPVEYSGVESCRHLGYRLFLLCISWCCLFASHTFNFFRRLSSFFHFISSNSFILSRESIDTDHQLPLVIHTQTTTDSSCPHTYQKCLPNLPPRPKHPQQLPLLPPLLPLQQLERRLLVWTWRSGMKCSTSSLTSRRIKATAVLLLITRS